MRNKHLEMRRRIEDAKSTLSDAEVFASPLYASVLTELARTTTQRYRRSCRVKTFWDDSDPQNVAATNNREIQLNAANYITQSLPSRRLRDQSLRGMVGHEVGHILFTDFSMMHLYSDQLRVGRWYPAEPAPESAADQRSLSEINEQMQNGDRATLVALATVGHLIHNILEDVYIEARVSEKFPGFAAAIALNNLRFAELMPTVEKICGEDTHEFGIVCNLMIQYCKAGDLNDLHGTHNRFLDKLYECLPILDEALYEDDGKARYAATNLLLVKLWPMMQTLRDEITKQPDPDDEQFGKELTETLNRQMGGSALPSGSGGAASGTGNGKQTKEEKQSLQEQVRQVLAEEGGRLPLERTEDIDTGGTGGVTYDDLFAGSGYSDAAQDMERVLEQLAGSRVCSKMESELQAELQGISDGIRYGNAHEGVHVTIHRMSEVPESLVRQYDQISPPLRMLSKRMQKTVMQVLEERRRGGRETGLLMGRRILARSLYHNDGHIFYKDRLPQEKQELAVALLVDESGSMSCADRITLARAASLVVYDFCHALHIPVLVQGHSTHADGVELYSYAEFEAVDGNDRYRIMDQSARAGNRDGAALRYVAERLARRPEPQKILILISDGQPADSGYYGTAAEEDLRGIKREYTNRGVTLFAAAIGDDKENIERIYGDGFLDISNLNELPANLARLIAQHIR